MRILAQRPFQIAFHEAPLGPVHGGAAHRRGAGNFLVAAAGVRRQQDLGPLELVGGAFALAQHRGQFVAFSLAQFDPITYIHLDPLVGEPDESTNESKNQAPPAAPARKASPKSRASTSPSFTPTRTCSGAPPPKPICGATSKSAHLRFTRWSSPSNDELVPEI
jgi:hypothetical protein